MEDMHQQASVIPSATPGHPNRLMQQLLYHHNHLHQNQQGDTDSESQSRKKRDFSHHVLRIRAIGDGDYGSDLSRYYEDENGQGVGEIFGEESSDNSFDDASYADSFISKGNDSSNEDVVNYKETDGQESSVVEASLYATSAVKGEYEETDLVQGEAKHKYNKDTDSHKHYHRGSKPRREKGEDDDDNNNNSLYKNSHADYSSMKPNNSHFDQTGSNLGKLQAPSSGEAQSSNIGNSTSQLHANPSPLSLQGSLSGVSWALCGAVLYACYMVFLRRRVKQQDTMDIPMFFGKS